MRVTQEYLKQVINEEMQKMAEEGQLDEGAMDFLKSLGGTAKKAGVQAAQKAGQAVASKAKAATQAVAGQAKKVGQAVGGAVQQAKKASAASDIAPLATKASASLRAAQQTLGGLVARMERLDMPEVRSLDGVMQALQTAMVQLQNLTGANTGE
jgi:hypothetical protein